MTEKELRAHREFLQQLVSGLGRDDIGVGELTEADGSLHFTLTRGQHVHQAQLPVGMLANKDQARAAVMTIIPKLSKVIEQEHIQAAQENEVKAR